jgi:ubiquinone/menaquinone biosynthesis C-methylase UbiE
MSLERQENSQNPWWGEHAHRYVEACRQIPQGSSILDIACGNGFGTVMLGRIAGSVVTGADISEETIESCKKIYTEENVRFESVDGTSLPYADASFDALVSFETIEHTASYDRMIPEFRRVLKPSGIAILSTPNFIVNSPTGIIENPYHTQEFTYEQLEQILAPVFSRFTIYGQKYTRYKITTPLMKLGKWIEHCFYKKGIRKLPMVFQNGVMMMVTGKKQYPSETDFEMVSERNEAVGCKTFFIICHPR